MSTNHTPHFNLSQWEPGDQVLRTDFNEDNAKIDAALARIDKTLWNRFRPELIEEIPLEAGVGEFTIDMTGVDWSEWAIVLVAAHIPHTMYLDNSYLSIYGHELNISTDRSENHLLAMYTGHSADGPLCAIGFPTGSISYKQAAYSDITELRFSLYNMGALRENAKVWIYGLK